MGLNSMVRSKGFKNFMSKLYGWGASIVILGALFKINHYPGADIMLIVGLGTEAIIFFFSAFEPAYVEPDCATSATTPPRSPSSPTQAKPPKVISPM